MGLGGKVNSDLKGEMRRMVFGKCVICGTVNWREGRTQVSLGGKVNSDMKGEMRKMVFGKVCDLLNSEKEEI